jgi:hypothetical protein
MIDNCLRANLAGAGAEIAGVSRRSETTRRMKECAYCGNEATTKDHIPPKALFPRPLPNGIDLVTVPCCAECNRRAADDDKYFAVILSSSIEAQQKHEGRLVWERLLSGGKHHPEEKGLWKRIRRNLRLHEARCAGGIILGNLPAHTNYEPRFYRVLQRIVKGFFFKLRGRRLPSDFTIVVTESPTKKFWDDTQDLKEALARNGCFEPMHNVFRLWRTAEKERPDVTLWYMIFLEAKDFLCLTAPRSQWNDPVYFQPPARR